MKTNPPPTYPRPPAPPSFNSDTPPPLGLGVSRSLEDFNFAQGQKFDQGKLRWSLLPTGTVQEVIKVLEVGAVKYAANNWQQVPDARTRYFDAIMRHLHAWWQGEKIDPESGLNHLAHAACSILFLLYFDLQTRTHIKKPKSSAATID